VRRTVLILSLLSLVAIVIEVGLFLVQMALSAAVASDVNAPGNEATISNILLLVELLFLLVVPGNAIVAGGIAIGSAWQNHQSGWLRALVVLLVLTIVGPLAGLVLFLYGAALILNAQPHGLGTSSAPLPPEVTQTVGVLWDSAGLLQLMPLLLGIAGLVYSLRSASRPPTPTLAR
jgi:hypothetical protein